MASSDSYEPSLAGAISAAGRGLPGIQRSTTNPPTSATSAAISVVACMASTNEVFAGASKDRPAGPRCWATAWVAVIDEDAAPRAAAGSAASDGAREFR